MLTISKLNHHLVLQSTCYELNYDPYKTCMGKPEGPLLPNVTVFADGVFKGVIVLKQIPLDCPDPIRLVSLYEEEIWTHRETSRDVCREERPWECLGRRQPSTSQGETCEETRPTDTPLVLDF